MELHPYGENGLRVTFAGPVSNETNDSVRSLYSYLKSLGLPGLIDVVPSFSSCLVIFERHLLTTEDLAGRIHAWRAEERREPREERRAREIPVRYGGDFGPDMEFVCAYCGLTEQEVVAIHTSSVYRVFAVGFLPGFPYCGPLDKRLFTPRLDTPRLKVVEGSVGITRFQTGVYPFDSPGGWRIIGKTTLRLFDPARPPYSLLKTGDLVRFVSEG